MEMIDLLRDMRELMEALAERQQRIYRAVERMDARLDMIERGAELREEIADLVDSGDMDKVSPTHEQRDEQRTNR